MLSFEQRMTYYVAQRNGGEPTPRQRRRLRHKDNREFAREQREFAKRWTASLADAAADPS
jgi:hypothetical protein